MTFTINMAEDFTSDWYKHHSGVEKLIRKNTFLIEWDNATGTLDGGYHIEIKQSSDGPITKIYPKSGDDVALIDSASNVGDVDVLDIDLLVATWRFIYEKNNITAGDMRVTAMSEVASA